ncbi:NACHT domain-containing protein [Gloeothece verrucosa]|uniref:Putative signal transduction protein with Nacht domain n=1 Tax=Gloeothece verrucosa (strain PCC 7822) TaxID=497965 RepID=E0UBT2_GLOV7|nr:HEAT repeat domain-containing protein [Gloeothece verrucosa]ADN15147.1 putative signal transduction protein with Nacht domain [Gloeothece verrucosa PCC 7822]
MAIYLSTSPTKTKKTQKKNYRKRFELNIYVPLGLVERKQQQRRKKQEDPDREKVYQLEETVITKEYQHETFLTEIIGGTGQENKHIAITGEPGAGKTTLLYKIAAWIEEHQKGLPILISLAALEKQSLEDYLLNNWLKKAEEFISEEQRQDKTALQEALKKRFREGGVWLLLDGLDEMAVNSSGGVLTTIQQYLEDWINRARIILTSRLNVWDEQKSNPLSDFKTFRTLQFTDEQVTEFIEDWFENDLSPNPSPARRGELDNIVFQLQDKLKEPQYQSIQELIHNPLRLAMLCEVWSNNPGQLPDTKAQLYELYVRDYYREWKPEQHQISREKQQLLNRKLGELALQQLDSEVRFRILESRAYNVMGEELFKLACRVGWLNIVDREAATDEPVYAFYHPSFQEYFAATVIDDWDYFLTRKHKNKPAKGKLYRIFEAKWKEPFLLWLGRGDVKKEEKEAFINKLVTFNDGCGKWENKGMYDYRAYLLAAMGVREFKNCSQTKEIVTQIINWTFSNSPIKDLANATLVETERETAISAWEALIQTSQYEWTRAYAALGLGNIAPGNEKAISALVALISTSQDELTRAYAVESLGKIAPGNEKAISALEALISTSQDESTRRDAAESLGEIAPGNEKAISALEALISTSQDESTRRDAAESLGEIAPGNEKAISALEALISTSQDESTRRDAAESLGEIAPGNEKAISALEALISTSQDESTRRDAAESLGEIAPGNEKAISALEALISTSQDESTRRDAAESLGEIAPGNEKAISALEALISTSQDEWTRRDAAESLGKIAPGNEKAISALEALISTSQDEWTRRNAAESLKQILTKSEMAKAVTKLKNKPLEITWQLLRNFSFNKEAYEIFSHCAQTLPYPEFYQAWHKPRNPWIKPLIIILLSGSVAGTLIYTQSQTSHPPAPPIPQPEINSK